MKESSVKGWKMFRIGECCEILDNRRVPLNREQRESMSGSIPYYGANGQVDGINDFIFDEDLILIAEDGGNFDDFQERPIAYRISGKSWVNNHAHVLRAKSGFDQGFIFYSLEHRDIRPFLNGGTRSKLNRGELDKIALPIPNDSVEQRKIGQILEFWDAGIKKIAVIHGHKLERKRSLMQQLLSGEKRLPGFTEKWQEVRLDEVAANSSLRNKGTVPDERLYAVTKAEGLIPMREHVKGATTDRCRVVKHDWFAYNPMRLNIGSLARLHETEPAMVSPDYVVFHCDDKRLEPDFLDHLRHTRCWQHYVNVAGNGSVRVRIYFKDLGAFKFHLPPIEEQRQIAKILNTCDREIALHRRQLEAIREQKRGLMQKLLTGEVRVKTSTD